jgi:serine/threonine protein kinase
MDKNISHFILEQKLGEGTFGTVRLAKHISTKLNVAVKILLKSKIKEISDKIRVETEIKILKILRHPYIVQLYSVIQSNSSIYLIMEYCKGKELYEHIVKNKVLQENEACHYFYQLICAVEYLHKNNIVHRDIKPENIIINEEKEIKLIDFGLSNFYIKNEMLKTSCGSPCYAAPEMICGKKYNCLPVDIWSCGIILFTMVCGYLPFEDRDTNTLYKKIVDGRFVLPSNVSDGFKDLIKKILVVDPNKRYTLSQIKAHYYISSFHNKSNLKYYEGLILSNTIIPIDLEIVSLIEGYGYNKNEIVTNIIENKHNDITTCYYILLKKKDDVRNSSNLKSDEFVNYKNNSHNKLSTYSNDMKVVISHFLKFYDCKTNDSDIELNQSNTYTLSYKKENAYDSNVDIRLKEDQKARTLSMNDTYNNCHLINNLEIEENKSSTPTLNIVKTIENVLSSAPNENDVSLNEDNLNKKQYNFSKNLFKKQEFKKLKTNDIIDKSSLTSRLKNISEISSIKNKIVNKNEKKTKLIKIVDKFDRSLNKTNNEEIIGVDESAFLPATEHSFNYSNNRLYKPTIINVNNNQILNSSIPSKKMSLINNNKNMIKNENSQNKIVKSIQPSINNNINNINKTIEKERSITESFKCDKKNDVSYSINDSLNRVDHGTNIKLQKVEVKLNPYRYKISKNYFKSSSISRQISKSKNLLNNSHCKINRNLDNKKDQISLDKNQIIGNEKNTNKTINVCNISSKVENTIIEQKNNVKNNITRYDKDNRKTNSIDNSKFVYDSQSKSETQRFSITKYSSIEKDKSKINPINITAKVNQPNKSKYSNYKTTKLEAKQKQINLLKEKLLNLNTKDLKLKSIKNEPKEICNKKIDHEHNTLDGSTLIMINYADLTRILRNYFLSNKLSKFSHIKETKRYNFSIEHKFMKIELFTLNLSKNLEIESEFKIQKKENINEVKIKTSIDLNSCQNQKQVKSELFALKFKKIFGNQLLFKNIIAGFLNILNK